MIDEGMAFSNKDIHKLGKYLGLDKYGVFVINFGVSFIIGLIIELIIFFVDQAKTIQLYFIPIIIIIGLYLILTFTKNYHRRLAEYKKAIIDKYNETNYDFDEYDKFIIGIIQNQNNKLNTNTCLLLTNGYKFVIKEDIFKVSPYNIDHSNQIKVLSDRVYDNKVKYEFLVNDILSFKLNGKVVSNGDISTTSYENKSFDTMTITLKDYTVLEISSNVYDVFRKAIGVKEVKNDN